MIWIVAWCGMVVAMAYQSIGDGALLGLGAGTLVFLIKDTLHKRRVRSLHAQYNALYGQHPGYDDRAQRYAGAVGALVGGTWDSGPAVAGSLLGAGLDYLRERRRKAGMSPEQVALYEELRIALAWRPRQSYVFFVAWILVAGGGVYFWQRLTS